MISFNSICKICRGFVISHFMSWSFTHEVKEKTRIQLIDML